MQVSASPVGLSGPGSPATAVELHTAKFSSPLGENTTDSGHRREPDVRPPFTVTIAGPQNGMVNLADTFTATVGPAYVKPPIGFIWNATGQNTVQTIANDLTHSVSFTWGTTGTKKITVTAISATDDAVAQYVINIGSVPLASVTIDGPTTGIAEADYVFRANIDPVDASLPITYSWSPVPEAGQGTSEATYRWTTSGIKTVVVSATNGAEAVTDSHVISIGIVLRPIEAVTITGPATGTINAQYFFSAVVNPPDATPPFHYEWFPAPDSGQGTAHPVYHWGVAGTQFIAVTATNAAGNASGSYSTTVLAISLEDVNIAGEKYPVATNDYFYYATVNPSDASLPITYTWWPTPTSGQGSSDVVYHWETGNTSSIFVTAANAYRTVTNSYPITIVQLPIPVQNVAIQGPSTGIVNAEYTFSTTVNPDATRPVLYEWFPTPGSGQGFDTARYSWSKPGIYTIGVTATNFYSQVTTIYTLSISSLAEVRSYLPLLLVQPCSFLFWECEPNNTYANANGPLVSGVSYYGYPTDNYDCYYFNMPRTGNVMIRVTDYTILNTQLLLAYQVNSTTYHLVTYDHIPPLELNWSGNSGKYVTCLFANSNFRTEPYTLTAVYP